MFGIVTKWEEKSGAKKCLNGGTHNGPYDALVIKKVERSRAVRSYADITREDVKTPLRQNIIIIFYIIYFIEVYLH